MNTVLIVLCALAMLVGIVGVVVPVLPGLFLCLAAVLAWALFDNGPTSTRWGIFALCVLWVLVGTVVKYAWPGARMKRSGIPHRSVLIGVVTGVVLMFPIPVVGLFIGFVAGVWVAEAVRLRGFRQAWPSTVEALRAAGLSVLVELAAAGLVAGTWVIGLVLV